MGINGSRYTIAEKFYYIELVNQGEINSNSIQRMYGITGLKHWPLGRSTKELKLKVVLEYLKGNTSYHNCVVNMMFQMLILFISGFISIPVVKNLRLGVRKQRLVMNLNLDTPHHACLSKMRRIMKENRIKASILIVKHDRKAERKEYISNNLFLGSVKNLV